MTKEKVLTDLLTDRDSWMLSDSIDYFDGCASTVFKAMDEYAKQECIELINFLMEDEGDANSVYQFYLQSKQTL